MVVLCLWLPIPSHVNKCTNVGSCKSKFGFVSAAEKSFLKWLFSKVTKAVWFFWMRMVIGDSDSCFDPRLYFGSESIFDSVTTWRCWSYFTNAPCSSVCLTQGWAGIPVSRDSREYKPQISLPVAFCNFPFPGKGSFGRELGREILSLFAVLRMAGQGIKMNKILNLTLLFIWFPGFPGIPGITSLKFPIPFPSRSIF